MKRPPTCALPVAMLCLLGVTASYAADTQSPDELIAAFQDRSNTDRAGALALLDASPVVDRRIAEELLQQALHDPDPLVAEVALQALVRRDNDQNHVLSEHELEHRQGDAADLARVHFAARYRDTETLRRLMRSGDAAVQESAFNVLAMEDGKAAIAELKAELADKGSLRRLQTLELLVRSGYTMSPRLLQPVLREATGDEDSLVADFAKSHLDKDAT